MNTNIEKWPLVSLGQVLTPVNRAEKVAQEATYRILGAHWYAQGLYIKDVLSGLEIRAREVYRVEKGDFVYNRLFGWKGSFAIANDENHGCYVSNEFPCFAVKTDRADGQYIWKYFSRSSIWDEVLSLSTGGTPTSRNRLKENQLLSMRIPLPPVEEQQRIVARIEELAARVHEARGLRQQAKEEVEALFASAITAIYADDIRWASVRDSILKRKGAVRSGPFGSQLLHEEFIESGVAAIGTRDVQANRFEFKSGWCVRPEKFEELRRYQVFPGDILCTIVGASIGRFCVVPNDIPLAFTTKHIQALTLDMATADARFVSYMLNFHRRCRESLFSQVEGSAQPSLNAQKVLATELPLPPLPEQRRVVAYLDDLQAKIDTLKKTQSETAIELDALMPSILDKAFKGAL